MLACATRNAKPDIRALVPLVGKNPAQQALETTALSAPSPNRMTLGPDIRGNSVIRLSISIRGHGHAARRTTVRTTAMGAAISGILNVARISTRSEIWCVVRIVRAECRTSASHARRKATAAALAYQFTRAPTTWIRMVRFATRNASQVFTVLGRFAGRTRDNNWFSRGR